MTGGSTRSSTSSGASSTVGRPGTSASATPVSTSGIAGGILSRAATTATAATTTSSSTRIWIVEIMRAPAGIMAEPEPKHQFTPPTMQREERFASPARHLAARRSLLRADDFDRAGPRDGLPPYRAAGADFTHARRAHATGLRACAEGDGRVFSTDL